MLQKCISLSETFTANIFSLYYTKFILKHERWAPLYIVLHTTHLADFMFKGSFIKRKHLRQVKKHFHLQCRAMVQYIWQFNTKNIHKLKYTTSIA